MKSATLPSLRVDPQLRDAAQKVLGEGESLSAFIEAAVREAIDRRHARREFLARGLASREGTIRAGGSVSTEELLGDLQRIQRATGKRIKGEA